MQKNPNADDVRPVLQRGAVRIPPSALRVTDADEEGSVFLLYTNLAGRKAADGTARFRGLGHIDSREDVLTISLKIGKAVEEQTVKGDDVSVASSNTHKARGPSKRKAQVRKRDEVETIEVEIVQDKTALRSRKGDTGSVLWHASVDFAEVILQQLHRRSPHSFFIPEPLTGSHVVELGAGTGLLGVVLSPFVRHYTITDIEELVPLIRKNVARNMPDPTTSSHKPKLSTPRSPPPSPTSKVVITALDWVQLYNTSASLQPNLVPADPADILLVVDCIYHPSLLPALLTTIDVLAIPDKTAVVVVVELRAEDVVREFLQGWLEKSSQGEWEIWSVGDLLEGPYAVWVGWKDTLSRDERER
ncbi:putative methyltransferase-domain-containing protein [Ganoderma leucocontextum]|nr:putative methyltransferase-domain-containing protein [Ganoderma leucocontextum]